MAIRFHFQKTTQLSNRRLLKDFIPTIFLRENKIFSQLDFVFCDNEYLLNINHSYLKHDFLTDIITFDLSDKSVPGILGEIYISIDMITDNAHEFNVSYPHELYRVMFHGVLHLCGYLDKSKTDKVLMRKKENYYLRSYLKLLKK